MITRRLLAASSIVVGACCTLSEDAVVRFKDYHDNCYVGKTLHDYMWFRKVQVGEARPIPGMPGHSEITYEKGSCRWVIVIDAKTTRIVSWRYVSDPSACVFPRPSPDSPGFHI